MINVPVLFAKGLTGFPLLKCDQSLVYYLPKPQRRKKKYIYIYIYIKNTYNNDKIKNYSTLFVFREI